MLASMRAVWLTDRSPGEWRSELIEGDPWIAAYVVGQNYKGSRPR